MSLKKEIAKRVFVPRKNKITGGEVTAPDEVADSRIAICESCDRFDKEKRKCMECGCFMDIKTKLAVNVTLKDGIPHQELTSCPLEKWSFYIDENNNGLP